MKENIRRESIEKACRIQLEVANQYVDSGEESVRQAYRYAYHHLDGMADGFLAAWDFEAYAIAKYYTKIAWNRMTKR